MITYIPLSHSWSNSGALGTYWSRRLMAQFTWHKYWPYSYSAHWGVYWSTSGGWSKIHK